MTVVLCGSLGATDAMWDAQVAVLPDTLVVDHPGHGGAPLVDVGDAGDLARAVLDVAPARFTFVGLSLGGVVGMWIALHEPRRLERLVLACTSARFGDPEQWRERAATVRREGVAAVVDAVLARWFTPSFPDVRRYREMFLSVDPEGYARCCDALARWDARGDVGRIAAPTLVLAGADDPSTPPEEVEQLARDIPGARFETIANARHLANVERPEEFNRLLLEHL